MLLDEPTSALDFRNQAILLLALKRIASEQGLTIVITTHDPTQALEVADRALLLHGVDRYEEGQVKDVLVPNNLSRLYGVHRCGPCVRRTAARQRSYRTLNPFFPSES